MPNPIVIAHHLIWTAYGWWLPNDPRGSMSKGIGCDIIRDLGELHYGRKRIQPASRDIRAFYSRAMDVLKFPLLAFGTPEIAAIADAFAGEIGRCAYTCYACAIMPDHIHLLIRKHKHQAEEMIENFQRVSHLRLRELGLRDLEHPIWGGPGWKVFLDHPDDVRRTVGYIEANPTKLRLPKQSWPFVRSYDGWPLHPGHSLNSPYMGRLQGRQK